MKTIFILASKKDALLPILQTPSWPLCFDQNVYLRLEDDSPPFLVYSVLEHQDEFGAGGDVKVIPKNLYAALCLPTKALIESKEEKKSEAGESKLEKIDAEHPIFRDSFIEKISQRLSVEIKRNDSATLFSYNDFTISEPALSINDILKTVVSIFNLNAVEVIYLSCYLEMYPENLGESFNSYNIHALLFMMAYIVQKYYRIDPMSNTVLNERTRGDLAFLASLEELFISKMHTKFAISNERYTSHVYDLWNNDTTLFLQTRFSPLHRYNLAEAQRKNKILQTISIKLNHAENVESEFKQPLNEYLAELTEYFKLEEAVLVHLHLLLFQIIKLTKMDPDFIHDVILVAVSLACGSAEENINLSALAQWQFTKNNIIPDKEILKNNIKRLTHAQLAFLRMPGLKIQMVNDGGMPDSDRCNTTSRLYIALRNACVSFPQEVKEGKQEEQKETLSRPPLPPNTNYFGDSAPAQAKHCGMRKLADETDENKDPRSRETMPLKKRKK